MTISYLEVSGGTIARDATWPNDIQYHILGSITVQGSNGADKITTLTIEPGAELRFNRNIQLNIGDISGDPDGTGDMVSDYVDYDPWVLDPDDMDGWYYE